MCVQVCDLTGVTLTRYMMEVCKANPTISELESLVSVVYGKICVGRLLGLGERPGDPFLRPHHPVYLTL